MKRAALLSLAVLAAPLAAAAPRGPVEHVARSTHPRVRGAGAELRVDMAFFDGESRVRWNGELVTAAGDCAPASFPDGVPASARCERRTLTLAPRVDACRCIAGTPVATHGAVLFFGFDAAARERWRRVRRPWGRAGGAALVGAHSTGLVFEDGEVWSPLTGATVRGGDRARRLSRSAYLPEADAFVEVDEDVTLVRTRGGLYLRSRDGTRALILPVDRRLVGHWTIEDLAPVPGTSLVLLGERFEIRGPGPARLTVLDLASRKVVFREELESDHLIGRVQVFAGPGGHLGISFLDENAGAYVVHHYRRR